MLFGAIFLTVATLMREVCCQFIAIRYVTLILICCIFQRKYFYITLKKHRYRNYQKKKMFSDINQIPEETRTSSKLGMNQI